jgi:hypothetical protein
MMNICKQKLQIREYEIIQHKLPNAWVSTKPKATLRLAKFLSERADTTFIYVLFFILNFTLDTAAIFKTYVT